MNDRRQLRGLGAPLAHLKGGSAGLGQSGAVGGEVDRLCQKGDLSKHECEAVHQAIKDPTDLEAFAKLAAQGGAFAACESLVATGGKAGGLCATLAGKLFDALVHPPPGIITGCTPMARECLPIRKSDLSALRRELNPGEYMTTGTKTFCWPMMNGGDPKCIPWPGLNKQTARDHQVAMMNFTADKANATPIAVKDWNGDLYTFDDIAKRLSWTGIDNRGNQFTNHYTGYGIEKVPPMFIAQRIYPAGTVAVFDSATNKYRLITPT